MSRPPSPESLAQTYFPRERIIPPPSTPRSFLSLIDVQYSRSWSQICNLLFRHSLFTSHSQSTARVRPWESVTPCTRPDRSCPSSISPHAASSACLTRPAQTPAWPAAAAHYSAYFASARRTSDLPSSFALLAVFTMPCRRRASHRHLY